MKIARVFPRRTNASPIDDLCFFDRPGLFPIEVDEVHISVTFTYDLKKAEILAKSWERVAPVKIGGPATGQSGENFTPGLYLKNGYVITSRGCNNNCWFCSVPKREGKTRELPITEGYNLLDDNILACSENHIRSVFRMLKNQKIGRPEFTGGLEAKILKDWHVDLLVGLNPSQMFFAYDTKDDWEPLIIAANKMHKAGFLSTSKRIRSYVLVGFPGDTINEAEKRLKNTLNIGVLPMAMLWKDNKGNADIEWKRFCRPWIRPAMIKMPILK